MVNILALVPQNSAGNARHPIIRVGRKLILLGACYKCPNPLWPVKLKQLQIAVEDLIAGVFPSLLAIICK